MSESNNLPSADAPTDPTELFRQNLLSKFSENLGELMPPEILQKIVAEAVESHLFRKVKKDDNWHSAEIPWIQREIAKTLDPMIKRVIEDAAKGHKETIQKMIEDQIKNEFPAMVAKFFAESLTASGAQLGVGIGDILRNSLNRY